MIIRLTCGPDDSVQFCYLEDNMNDSPDPTLVDAVMVETYYYRVPTDPAAAARWIAWFMDRNWQIAFINEFTRASPLYPGKRGHVVINVRDLE